MTKVYHTFGCPDAEALSKAGHILRVSMEPCAACKALEEKLHATATPTALGNVYSDAIADGKLQRLGDDGPAVFAGWGNVGEMPPMPKLCRHANPEATCHVCADQKLLGGREATVQEVREAMNRAQSDGGYPHYDAWWKDPHTNAAINEGVRMGWIYRPSTTQVQWTERGVVEVQRVNADRAADLLERSERFEYLDTDEAVEVLSDVAAVRPCDCSLQTDGPAPAGEAHGPGCALLIGSSPHWESRAGKAQPINNIYLAAGEVRAIILALEAWSAGVPEPEKVAKLIDKLIAKGGKKKRAKR